MHFKVIFKLNINFHVVVVSKSHNNSCEKYYREIPYMFYIVYPSDNILKSVQPYRVATTMMLTLKSR